MDWSALLLSRIQFAFTTSFHIIFPAFTIGLAAWLAVLEAMSLATGNGLYRRVFDYWLRIFAVAFGMGVVSGIVMAFQFGTHWSELSRMSGPVQGPLLTYESLTAFALEAGFFGVMLFGRNRVPKWFYLVACLLVALGTTLSAFWIMVNNSWMQAPMGTELRGGIFVPTDWARIVFNRVVWSRFPHMLLAAYITTCFCVAAVGARPMLRGRDRFEAAVMLRMGLGLAAVLLPLQMLFGHLAGDVVHDLQPTKFAAIEGRWHTEQPAAEVLLAWPDAAAETNRYEWKIPVLGSLIASGTPDSKEVGLADFPRRDRPPVLVPFLAFRVMVGCGLLMLLLAWVGSWIVRRPRLAERRGWLRALAWSFPLGFVATLTGWITAEVGRQPWTVWGVLRTADALTPGLTPSFVAGTLAEYVVIYGFIFVFGVVYIYRLIERGVAPVDAATVWNGHPIPRTYRPDPQWLSQRLDAQAPSMARRAARAATPR